MAEAAEPSATELQAAPAAPAAAEEGEAATPPPAAVNGKDAAAAVEVEPPKAPEPVTSESEVGLVSFPISLSISLQRKHCSGHVFC